MKFKRIVTVVLDSVGIGYLPDSMDFGDIGVNTLGNISKSVGLNMPNLEKMGLGNIVKLETIKEVDKPTASYGKMKPKSNGKDTLTGHWEMMGVTLQKGFKVYIDHGFDEKLINEFKKRTGRGVLGNKEANGLKVIDEFFEEHMETGDFIVYTSVDSTFQIAAHEDVVSIDELYKACEVARELTKGSEYNVARVIARPFIGDKDNVERTSNRKDYALNPPGKTVMEALVEKDVNVLAIGKIYDIFNGIGINEKIKTKSNMDGVDKTIEVLKSDFEGFLFVNLVDFDSKYGHPRDVEGYKKCLEEFDVRVREILNNLKDSDLLIIVADHGNDPTYKGNDHTREFVPLIVYNKNLDPQDLGIRETFEDLGQTIAENFEVAGTKNGKSFL